MISFPFFQAELPTNCRITLPQLHKWRMSTFNILAAQGRHGESVWFLLLLAHILHTVQTISFLEISVRFCEFVTWSLKFWQKLYMMIKPKLKYPYVELNHVFVAWSVWKPFIFFQDIKTFNKENSMLGIQTKPDWNSQKLSVCSLWPPPPPPPLPAFLWFARAALRIPLT